MTPRQRALQIEVTDPLFQLPTQLDAMEAQRELTSSMKKFFRPHPHPSLSKESH